MTTEITFENGKYTYLFDEETGRQVALRYGEEWRDLTGDNFVAAMANLILHQSDKLTEKTFGGTKVFCNQEDLRRIMREAAEESKPRRLNFPVELRKMWTGAEVQAWIDERTILRAPEDPLQGAANWLVEIDRAQDEGHFSMIFGIGHNRAKRLFDNAVATLMQKMAEKSL